MMQIGGLLNTEKMSGFHHEHCSWKPFNKAHHSRPAAAGMPTATRSSPVCFALSLKTMYKSKVEVEQILDELDALVNKCIDGKLSFESFLSEYGYPMGYYALDGHESDEAGKYILDSLADRISLHSEITEHVLHKVCTAEQARDPAYKNSSLMTPSEAFPIFKKVVSSHVPQKT